MSQKEEKFNDLIQFGKRLKFDDLIWDKFEIGTVLNFGLPKKICKLNTLEIA